MKCERARSWFSDLLDGSISDARRVVLEAHLADCRGCSAELSLFRTLWQGLAALPEKDAPVTLRATIWQRIEAAETAAKRAPVRRQVSWRFPVWARALAVVAGVLLLFVLTQATVPGRFRAAGWTSWFGPRNGSGEVPIITGTAQRLDNPGRDSLSNSVRVRLQVTGPTIMVDLVLMGPNGDITSRRVKATPPVCEFSLPMPVDSETPTAVRAEWQTPSGTQSLEMPLTVADR